MEHEERLQKLDSYRRAHEKLVDSLQQFPREMWRFKPAEDAWSIQEIANHILDSEIHAYIRIRMAIAQPGATILPYDGDLWARACRYQDASLEEAVELFGALRFKTNMLLQSLPAEIWQQAINHPERGVLSLDDLLETYEAHIPEHLNQMWVVYSAWVDADW